MGGSSFATPPFLDPGILTAEELRSCGELSGIQALCWSSVSLSLADTAHAKNPRKEMVSRLLPSGPSGCFLAHLPWSLSSLITFPTACRSPF